MAEYSIVTNIGLSNNKIKSRIFCAHNNSLYYILNYDKPYVCTNDVATGMYRSVILSFPEKEVLCFSPPKSIPMSLFMEKPHKQNQIRITEIVEGIMINLFYDPRNRRWEIATKNAIGGKYRVNNKTTIYRLVLDAFAALPEQTELSELTILEYLPKNHCYSFVLRKMATLTDSRLILVASYEMYENGSCKMVYPATFPSSYDVVFSSIIEFPQQYETTDGLTRYMMQDRETGERVKVDPKPFLVKSKPKSSPSTLYLYLCLRRINKLSDYLLYYPLQAKQMIRIQKQYDRFIHQVLELYVDFYIKKNQPILVSPLFTHAYKIHHDLYLPSLRKHCSSDSSLPKLRKIITKEVVMDYFEEKEPRELLFLLQPFTLY